MLFTSASTDLRNAVLSVIKALPTRTTMNILEGIFMDASSGHVRLKCSDLTLEKECYLSAVVEEEGKVIIPAKLFAEIVRRLPDDRTATVSVEGTNLHIECGSIKMNIQTIDYEEFPEMRFTGESYTLKMNREACKSFFLQTVFAAAQDDAKPILTGVLLELGDGITAVATDAYQFAMRKMELTEATPEKKTVIPAKSLTEIAHLMDETETETVDLTFTRTHVKIDLQHTCIVARLLDGEYINYRQLIPKEYKTRALINREEMMKAIDRAQLMAREGNNNILLRFANDTLTVNANSFVGKVHEEMPIQLIGEDLEIAFNPKYCLNVLKNISDENVYLDMVSGISPCAVRPVNGEDYLYLIVPVRVYSQY